MWYESAVGVGATLTVVLLFTALAANAGPSDFQSKLKIKRPLSETSSGSVETRLATNFNEISYRHLDLGLQLTLSTDYQLAAHYRAIAKKSSANLWLRENRIYVQLEKRFAPPAAGWGANWLPSVKIRNRLESRSRQSKNHAYRYRLRFKLKSTQRRFGNFKPFASNEFFYDFNKHQRTVNRFDLGLDLGKIGRTKQSTYLKFISRQINGHWVTESSLVYSVKL
ncbi:MAG: DUF2490 domain-containing protein [Immundisolibacteraceae bacterium]|nr:DUF2490 domain-containing protein [Immundisolibacteraceae bacterium]